jgi:hypothetical protein
MTEQQQLPLPPLRSTADGSPRRIGVEIEFAGLTIDRTAELLRAELGGQTSRVGRYELAVDGDPAGPWKVELDFELLKTMGRRARGEGDFGGAVEELAEDVLRVIAEQIVPVEIISPPLPMERLGDVNGIIGRLRAAGARGTAEELVYAFGMQFNPEMPDTDADTIRHYLQAYLCLEDWLRERAQVDLTRRLTFFADPFPKGYARATIDPGYSPNRDQLIDDYLAANPTRNRALDMLPLFAHVDEQRVRARVDDERIKPRPTLHYRLPNSEIDRPDWGLNDAWSDWLVVERLAASPARLGELCQTYAAFLDRLFGRLTGDWKEETAQWLDANQLR